MSHILLPPGKYGIWLIFLLPTGHLMHNFIIQLIAYVSVVVNDYCIEVDYSYT